MRQLGLISAAFFVAAPSACYADNYGHIPDARIFLGKSFDPLYPQRKYRVCVQSPRECQTNAKDSIACISGKSDSNNTTKMSNGVSFTVRQIKSKYDYFREVNISASLSGSYGAFSGSGSLSSYSLDDITEDSLNWIVAAKASYGTFSLSNPTLLQEIAEKKLSNSELLAQCGSSFVSEVERGVAAVALFSVYNLDEKHKRDLRASMSAGFAAGDFGGSASAKFSEVVKTALQYGSMSIRVNTIGGGEATGLADLINKNPTDLNEVKNVLSNFVRSQTIDRSAILDFGTMGIGKLIGNASIDPDQSNYLYYLERANDYRLQVVDASRKVDRILEAQRDFDQAVVASAQDDAQKLACELEYAELAMQGCRYNFDAVRQLLSDGAAANDRTAELALNFGLPADSSRLQVCRASTSTSFLGSDGKATLATLGWKQNSSARSRTCTDKIASLKDGFAEMVRRSVPGKRAISARTEVRGGRADRPTVQELSRSEAEPPCITGCELERDDSLLASVRALPTRPFDLTYWYDSSDPSSYGNSTSPGLNVVIDKAENISAIKFYKGNDTGTFGVRNNSGSSYVVIFMDLPSVPVDVDIRLELESKAGNVYVVNLPRFKALTAPP